MAMRYKIRRELNGAFIFDAQKRCVFYINENELNNLLDFKMGKQRNLSSKLKKMNFFHNAAVDFIIIDPLKLVGLKDNGNVWLSAPNRLYLELTRQCNLHCMQCYNKSGTARPNELSVFEIKKLLDEMQRIGVFEARLTGGEPTIRNDFFEILDYVIESGFYVSLATNGVWDEDLRKKICERGIDDVIVSLDGDKEVNNKFRSGGDFQKTLNAIDGLKRSGVKNVRINTVISKMNYQKMEPLFQICDRYDLLLIDLIHPRPFGNGASSNGRKLMLNDRETLEFNCLVQGLRKKYPTVKAVMDFDLLGEINTPKHPIVPRVKACPAGREFAFISPQGYMFPCGVAPINDISLMSEEDKKLFIAGNILEKTILDLWHNASVWKNYRDLAKCKPQKCHHCEYWGSKCFGTCPIGAYYDTGKLNGEDPYCYSHLL